MTTSRGPGRLRRCAPLLLAPLLASCFTMTLWGFEPIDEVDPFTGREETVFEYDEATEWSWRLFFTRLGLTPLSLVLDAATCPIQAVLFGMDSDD